MITIFVGRDGRAAVIKLGPEYELLALNELDDRIDASPVFVGDRLDLRGKKRLYALEGSASGDRTESRVSSAGSWEPGRAWDETIAGDHQ